MAPAPPNWCARSTEQKGVRGGTVPALGPGIARLAAPRPGAGLDLGGPVSAWGLAPGPLSDPARRDRAARPLGRLAARPLSGSMSWLLLPLGLGGIGLLLNYRPRLWASLIALCWLWLMGLDQFLLSPLLSVGPHGGRAAVAPPPQRRVSLWACLPLLVLCGAVWFWSGCQIHPALVLRRAPLLWTQSRRPARPPSSPAGRRPGSGCSRSCWPALGPGARPAAWVALLDWLATATASWVTGSVYGTWASAGRSTRAPARAGVPCLPRPYFLSAAMTRAWACAGPGARWPCCGRRARYNRAGTSLSPMAAGHRSLIRIQRCPPVPT